MEHLFDFVIAHAQYAHWVIFGLLILAGCNLLISEDLVIIIAGILASTVVPQNVWKLFLGVFLGAYLSDWFVYWLGRQWGDRLWRIPWFARMLPLDRLRQIESYYTRYGMLTLLIGRFIPFGVRNCLFMTAGMGRMSLWKFMVYDGIACLSSNTLLFTLAYFTGKNCLQFVAYINIGIFAVFLVALIGFIWYKRRRTG